MLKKTKKRKTKWDHYQDDLYKAARKRPEGVDTRSWSFAGWDAWNAGYKAAMREVRAQQENAL